MTTGFCQLIDLGLLHRNNDLVDQSVQVLDLLGCGLAASLGNLFLGLLGLLGLGFLDHDDGLGSLFPEDAVLAVLQVQQIGAVTLKVRCPCPLATLGQEQLVVAFLLGGAEKVDDEHIRSRPLLALERLLKR